MIYSIQILRAFAAWAVAMLHFVQIYGSSGNYFQPIPKAFNGFGAGGVDLFFVISGFVMFVTTREKPYSPFEFISNRIARIAPAYYFVTVVAIFVVYIDKNFFLSRWMGTPLLDFQFILKSLLFIPTPNPPSGLYMPFFTLGWTLNYEMFFYILFTISLFFKKNHQFFVTSLLMISIYLLCSNYASGSLTYYGKNIIFEFLLGIFIGSLYINNKYKLPFSIGICIFLGSFLFVILRGSKVANDLFSDGIPAALMVFSSLSLSENLKKFKYLNFFSHLGDISYSTYLLHPFIFFLIYKIFLLFNNTRMNFLIAFIVSIILLYFTSLLSYYIIEKNSSIFLKHIFNSLKIKITISFQPLIDIYKKRLTK